MARARLVRLRARARRRAATREQLLGPSTRRAHVDVDRGAVRARRRLRSTRDTAAVAGTWEAALRAAGGAVALVDALLGGEARDGRQRACARPATTPSPTARWASASSTTSRSRRGTRAAAHGARAGADPRLGRPPRQRDQRRSSTPRADVLFVSIHESPLYPGTGAGVGRRVGRGRGLHGQPARARRLGRRRLALAGRARRRRARARVGAAARARLGRLRRPPRRPAGRPARSARRASPGWRRRCGAPPTRSARRSGVVLEGGYDLGALARSMAAVDAGARGRRDPGAGRVDAHPLAERALARLAPWWPGLAAAA